jgi:ribosomal protein L17
MLVEQFNPSAGAHEQIEAALASIKEIVSSHVTDSHDQQSLFDAMASATKALAHNTYSLTDIRNAGGARPFAAQLTIQHLAHSIDSMAAFNRLYNELAPHFESLSGGMQREWELASSAVRRRMGV